MNKVLKNMDPWPRSTVHFKSLADGADSNLDGASPDALSTTTATIVDMFGKGSEEFDALGGGDICELGVHMTEGCDKV